MAPGVGIVASAEAFPLDETAETVLLALIEHPATAGELAATSGLKPGRLEAVMARLVEAGLVVRDPDSPGRYAAAGPQAVWRLWLAERRDRQRSARNPVPGAAPQTRPEAIIERLDGREAILARLGQLQRSARLQVRAVDKPPYVLDVGGYNMEGELESLARGVRWRAIYDPAGLTSLHHRMKTDMQVSVTSGEESRLLADPPMKLMIFDESAALIPVVSRPTAIAEAVVVHPSAMLDALIELFERLWTEALPLGLAGATPEAGQSPSVEDLELLGLLTAGLTDEVIARHLQVGVRTVHRRLQALMERLGARTRFQAALYAARRGWLPDVQATESLPIDDGHPDPR